MQKEPLKTIRKWEFYAFLYSFLLLLAVLTVILTIIIFISALCSGRFFSLFWVFFGLALLLSLVALSFWFFLKRKGVRRMNDEILQMQFEPFELKIPCRSMEDLMRQLKGSLNLRKLKHVPNTWFGSEHKKKELRVFLFDHTVEQKPPSSVIKERINQTYEKLHLRCVKSNDEARKLARVFFFVFNTMPEEARCETTLNAIEWMVDECDRELRFAESTVRAYVELSSGTVFLPRCVTELSGLIGCYRYCIVRILAWLGLDKHML